MNVGDELTGRTVHVTIDNMDFYLTTVNTPDGNLDSIMITGTRTDADVRMLLSGINELINLLLLYKVPLVEITRRLKFIRGESAGFTNNETVRSTTGMLDFIAKYLEKIYLGEEGEDGWITKLETITSDSTL